MFSLSFYQSRPPSKGWSMVQLVLTEKVSCFRLCRACQPRCKASSSPAFSASATQTSPPYSGALHCLCLATTTRILDCLSLLLHLLLSLFQQPRRLRHTQVFSSIFFLIVVHVTFCICCCLNICLDYTLAVESFPFFFLREIKWSPLFRCASIS